MGKYTPTSEIYTLSLHDALPILLGEFAPSAYRILNEAQWPVGEETEPLLTRDGRLIARVAPAFKQRLDTEGSARLRDERVVNFDEKVRGRWRYVVARSEERRVGEAWR